MDRDDYPVRLVGGNTETEGRVEIFFYGQWGTICSSEWDPRDASVVCRQLGLYGPNTSVTDAYFGEGSGHVLMKNVQCIGNETHLSDCAFQGWGNDCFHNLDASVLCQIGEDFPVRLVGREDTNGREGLLQVAFRGEWGAVCGSGLQALSSIVICRLLGYNGTSMSYPVAVRSLPAVPGIATNRIPDDSTDRWISRARGATVRRLPRAPHRLPFAEQHQLRDLTEAVTLSPARLTLNLSQLRRHKTWSPFRPSVRSPSHGALSETEATSILQPEPSPQSVAASGPPPPHGDSFRSEHGSAPPPASLQPVSSEDDDIDYVAGLTQPEDNPDAARDKILSDSSTRPSGPGYPRPQPPPEDPCHASPVVDSRAVPPVPPEDGAGDYFHSSSAAADPEPVGGRPGNFIGFWREITSDSWVLSTVAYENSLEFTSPPSSGMVFRSTPPPYDKSKRLALEEEISTLLPKRAITPVYPNQLSTGFHSSFFLTRKKEPGKWRPIINLKPLNKFMKPRIAKTVAPYLRRHDVLIFQYLDNLLIVGHSPDEARACTSLTLDVTTRRGFLVNHDKSALDPAQRLTYLGAILDLHRGIAGRTPERILNLQQCVIQFLRSEAPPALAWLRLPGPMASRLRILVVFQRRFLGGYVPGGLLEIPFHLHQVLTEGCSAERDCSRRSNVSLDHWDSIKRRPTPNELFIVDTLFSDDEFPIRLVGGLTNTEGRVEILFRGRWANVEDDGWDRTDSGVVCRQLGFGGPSLAVLNIFGEGRGPTRMNRVNCQGNEDRLIDCPFSTSNRDFIRNDFNPKQSHLGVTCQTEEAFQVRLVGGPNARSGRVELQFRGQWGAVCGAVWATADASVVCRQLGFDGASIATAGIVSHDTFQGSVYIDVASCRGNESRLIDCEMKKGHRLGDYHCAGSIYAEAICQADEDFPVRLMDGASDEIGRVEVYVSGQWGSVCSSNWNIEDARVVCNQLGFDGAEASVYRPLLPPGTGPVFMNSVRCVGNESKLAHCQFHGWKTYAQFCGSKRVGVVCKDVFRRTCPPPEARLDYSGLYVISVLVPRGDSSANVSWSKPVVKNQPEKSVEYTTCQQVGGNATPWPCQSGDQFNVTYNWRVQKVGWDTLVEYVVLDRSGSKNISHTCSFYVSVREKAFDNALAPVRPPLDREVISTLQPVVSVLVNCTHNVTFDPILGPLTWLETMPGTQAECVERCPPVSQKYGMPLAVRNCSTSGIEGRISRWQNPEIRNCGPIRITTDLKQVSQLPVVRANVTTVAEYLASKTSKTSKFDDVTLEHASDILHVLACMGVGEPKITDYLHEAVSNIMKSLHANRGSDCRRSRSLVSIRDSIQTQISSSLRQEGAVRIHKEFIQAKAVGLNLSHVGSDLSFAWFKSKLGADTLVGSDIRMYDSISEIPGDASTTISLSGRVLQLAQAKLGNNTFEQIHATFVIYGDDTLFPSYRMTKSEGGNHFTFPGGVVSISVDDVQLTNHSVPVVVEFQVPVIDDTQFAVCVFWDFTLENGAGDWSNVGCEINLLTNGRYRCLCNQATHFAIYLEMARELRVHQRKLDPIVRISCIISASFYLLLLAFLTLRRLRGSTFSPSFAQFILSLLMLYLVFTAGVDTAKGSAFWCVVVSALLQYLPLTTLVWTAIEARSVYVSARPTDQAIKSPVRVTIASLLAWGLPMLVTGGSLFLTFDLHGRGDFCLLGDELPLYFGIGLPFWLILIHNLVHSGLVLAIICKTWNQPSSRWIIGQLGAFIGTYTLITATCYFGFQTARYPSGSYTYIFCAAIFIQMIVTCCALLVKLRETFDAGRSKAADDKSEAERESPLQDSSEVTISPPVSCGSKGLELNIMESGIFD
ncbi:uncharacterized protein LOC110985413 [Acanthaster planci]|uniref:Uncharacterized protein LOC110985413 n=1 Tax=Acanthaster planci TaxID=133434 RepID=A0A8B7Z8X2_ACAPL|nr:uncharacterized protein LOC110985413 [Acanthaster planci]